MDMKLFSQTLDFVAMQPVLIDGVQYRTGDPVQKGGLDERFLRRMCEHRYLIPAMFADADLRRAMERGSEAHSKAMMAQPPAKKPAVGGFDAVHKGFGRWSVVDASGSEQPGTFKQADAEARVALLNGG
jgi:hypothetical protein